MIERSKHRPIEKNTPEGNRWVVISCVATAAIALKRMGVKPMEGEIMTFIKKAKSNPQVWELFMEKAHRVRASELGRVMGEDQGPEGLKGALVALNQKYRRINEDRRRNFSYLDDIVLENGMDESQEPTSQG